MCDTGCPAAVCRETDWLLLTVDHSTVKWPTNAATLISGTAKRCWKLPGRKEEFLVMQCPGVSRLIVVVRKTLLFLLYSLCSFVPDFIELVRLLDEYCSLLMSYVNQFWPFSTSQLCTVLLVVFMVNCCVSLQNNKAWFEFLCLFHNPFVLVK